MIVALLAWWDEPPTALANTVLSLRGLADHLVAVDGAYALVPGGTAWSPSNQKTAIGEAAEDAGLGLTLYVPDETWAGNEIEKRARMFEIGRTVARSPLDWFLVIDADEQLEGDAEGLRRLLAETELDVARVRALVERDMVYEDTWRRLFRAIDGLTVTGAHCVYVGASKGRRVTLWGHPHREEPALDASSLLTFVHKPGRRPLKREEQRHAWVATASRMETADVNWDGQLPASLLEARTMEMRTEVAKLAIQLALYRQALDEAGVEPPDRDSDELLALWRSSSAVISTASEFVAQLGSSKELLAALTEVPVPGR